MKTTVKRAVILALTLLFAACALLPLTAGAAGGNPVDPKWSGMTASWKPPAKPVATYTLTLFRDGSLFFDSSTTATSYDYSDLIKNAGSGDYMFGVAAVFESDYSLSDMVYSDTLNYKGEPHPHSVKHIGFKYPTCTEDGVKEHYECPVCQKYYWDYMCQNEITDKDEVVLPATGHNWGEWKTTKQPTETQEGEAKRVCNNDSNHVETKVLPKITPSTVATTAPATTQATTAPAGTVPSTAPTAETTQPATDASGVVVTHSTLPAVTLPTIGTSGGNGDGKILGLTVGWFTAALVGAIVLFIITPLVIVLIIVLTKKKRSNQPPDLPNGQPPMNGSEYLPPQGPNHRYR